MALELVKPIVYLPIEVFPTYSHGKPETLVEITFVEMGSTNVPHRSLGVMIRDSFSLPHLGFQTHAL